MKNLNKHIKIILTCVVSMVSLHVFSQGIPTDTLPGDPARVAVYTLQNLKFGAFTQGAIGGTVVISSSGIRTVTGDVVALNMGYIFNEAIFELEGIIGTVVSINNGPNVTLTGTNGGSMSMSIGSSSPASPFIIAVQPPSRTQIRIGGTLNVGSPAANPAGNYTGTLFITFNQE